MPEYGFYVLGSLCLLQEHLGLCFSNEIWGKKLENMLSFRGSGRFPETFGVAAPGNFVKPFWEKMKKSTLRCRCEDVLADTHTHVLRSMSGHLLIVILMLRRWRWTTGEPGAMRRCFQCLYLCHSSNALVAGTTLTSFRNASRNEKDDPARTYRGRTVKTF